MTQICPSILADNQISFETSVNKILTFAKRIQIDITDGKFAPTNTLDLSQVQSPKGILTDIHLMQFEPNDQLGEINRLKPNLVIIHAEANASSVENIIEHIDRNITKIGLALLPETQPDSNQIATWLMKMDHCLIFGGHLGFYGGEADLNQVGKVNGIKIINSNIEIGWDGGANPETIRRLIDGGIDVINVGGFIQNSQSPENAYAILEQIASEYQDKEV